MSLVMMAPWKAPMTGQAAMPTMRPAHQGQLVGEPIRASAMAAPTAPTKATERSISLRMRAYSSAMPRRMMKVAWTNRLTMFVAREERARLHLEEDADDDEADDDRERAALPAADPLPPGAQVVAQGVGQRSRASARRALRAPWRWPGGSELRRSPPGPCPVRRVVDVSVIVPPPPARSPVSTGPSSGTRPPSACRSRMPVPAPPAGRGRGWRSARPRRRRRPGCARPS